MAFAGSEQDEDKKRKIAQRVFRTIDKKMNGDVEFKEFAQGLTRMGCLVRVDLQKRFYEAISGGEEYIELEDLVDFFLSEELDPVAEGFRSMLIGACETRSFRRLKSTLDLAGAMTASKKRKNMKRRMSAGNFSLNMNLKPIATRKDRPSKAQLVDRISQSMTTEPTEHARRSRVVSRPVAIDSDTDSETSEEQKAPPTRTKRLKSRKVPNHLGPTAPPTGPTAPRPSESIRSTSLSESESGRDEAKTNDARFSTSLDDRTRQTSLEDLVGELGSGFTQVSPQGRSQAGTATSYTATSRTSYATSTGTDVGRFSRSYAINPHYKPSKAWKKKNVAIWKTVITLLGCRRRERNFRASGVSKKVTDIIRDFVPFDDVHYLDVNFKLTDLVFCSKSNRLLAASCDGIFKYEPGMACWTLVYKLSGTSQAPVYLASAPTGDIYFTYKADIYRLPYKEDTAIVMKPKGNFLSRLFTSVQATADITIDGRGKRLYFLSNDKCNCIDLKFEKGVTTLMKLDFKGAFVTYDTNRSYVYASDVAGRIYMANHEASFTVMQFDDNIPRGLSVDPVKETLIIHNKSIQQLEPGTSTKVQWKLRRIASAGCAGDVVTFDSRGERVLFVDSRPHNGTTRIGILQFR